MSSEPRAVVLYETEPSTEWILGWPVQKVSPRYTHAALQGFIAGRLMDWAFGRGRVGSEWRFWLAPRGEYRRYLVPDIAYLSYARVPRSDVDDVEEPNVAPDVVVEIRSPGDRPAHAAHKIEVYLAAGTSLVIAIDPSARTVDLHERNDVVRLADGDTIAHAALPGFNLAVTEMFDRPRR